MSWPRLAEKTTSNRAVTPFFRVFGGNPGLSGDAIRRAEGSGHHRLEMRVLSVLVPLVAGAAVFDTLWITGGPWVAAVGVLPVLFILLHLVAFFIGGGTPRAQWLRWSAILSAWSVWLCVAADGGVTSWAAYLWLGFIGLNGLGLICLGWQKLMTHPWLCTSNSRWGIWVVVHIPAAIFCLTEGWLAGVGFLAGIGALWASGTFLPNSSVFGPIVSRVEGKGVLLTFDDGPDPADTPVILDLLDQHGQKAVFFVIGQKVRRFPELAREIVRRGHELGNHTMTHPVGFFWGAGSIRTRREIVACSRAIEEVTGVKPRWFRAPAGHRNWFTHPVLREEGLELMGWSKRAYDTIRSDVSGIVTSLTRGARDGDILLLHESTAIAEALASAVLEATAALKKDGFPDAGDDQQPPSSTIK